MHFKMRAMCTLTILRRHTRVQPRQILTGTTTLGLNLERLNTLQGRLLRTSEDPQTCG